MAWVSLLDAIFGTCECRGFFECTLPIDSHGGVFLWILLMVYAFRMLHMVCDDHFVPSLESIVDKLNVPNNVASWTFIALGSSAPRVCVSFIATFLLVDAAGLGAVVGACVFNVLIIIGTTGFVACKDHHNVHICWHPLLRDAGFFLLGLLELYLMLIDDVVRWYEALVLLLTFCVYGATARFGGRLGLGEVRAATRMEGKDGEDSPDGTESLPPPPVAEFSGSQDLALGSQPDSEPPAEITLTPPEGSVTDSQDSATAPCPLLGVMKDPLVWLLETAMPAPEERGWLLLGLSLLCILVITYVATDSVDRVGKILNVPPVTVGLTLLAMGTSASDAMGSIAVARQEEGDLAVANALGVSVFDLYVGLGLPWMLRCITHKSVVLRGEFHAIRWDLLLLVGFVLFLLGAIYINRQRLSRCAAGCLILLYGTYCLYTFAGLFLLRSEDAA